jgi:hypothetical protein
MPIESPPLALALRAGLPVVRAPHRRTGHVVALAVAAGALSTSIIPPLAVLATIASLGVLGLVVLRVGAAPLRDALAERRVRRARHARRLARERKLQPVSVGYHALADLTRMVDGVEARDPDVAQRFDLEGLLDRHVALTLGHEQALRAVRMADRLQLERIREGCRADPEVHPRRLELCERRLRSLDQCEARAAWFADQLAILADTIHLIAQQVACPEDPIHDDTIERQLAELDDHDAARREIAAELH